MNQRPVDHLLARAELGPHYPQPRPLPAPRPRVDPPPARRGPGPGPGQAPPVPPPPPRRDGGEILRVVVAVAEQEGVRQAAPPFQTEGVLRKEFARDADEGERVVEHGGGEQ